jgi:alkylresorcinol/alkylpyrone synthase
MCSLTVQRNDRSTANLVASGLFGDGAAAVVVAGADRGSSGPRIVDSRSRLYPDSERAMGWDIGSSGLKIVLGTEVPALVERYLGDDVRGFLADHDLKVDDISGWVCHPGGPKVLEAVQTALALPADALQITWDSLATIGNLSSASVLHVLHDTLERRPQPPGTPGLLMAMGPGFAAELVLLRW